MAAALITPFPLVVLASRFELSMGSAAKFQACRSVVEHLVDVQNERSTRLGSAAFAMRRLWRTAL
jgi:hypothetical protein